MATEFYRQRRAEMDAGAQVAWEERFKPDELSAVQNAINLFFGDRDAFFSEFQNEPENEAQDSRIIEADELAKKINGLVRGVIPARSHLLTGFVDVHEDLLYWGVVAWGDGYTGDLVDYGFWPPQPKKYFLKRQCRPDLITWWAKEQGRPPATVSLEEALYAGLDACTRQMFERGWKREDDADLALRRVLIDASHGPTSALVKSFCKQSPFHDLIWPSHGVGKTKLAMFRPTKSAKEKGDRFGFKWRLTYSSRRENVAHLSFDANFWKTFLWSRLRVSLGGSGCLAFFGEWASARAGSETRPKIRDEHKLLIEHIRGETPSVETAGEESIEVWKANPNEENHLLDVLVGNCVAASYEGITMAGHAQAAPTRQRKKYSLGSKKKGAA